MAWRTEKNNINGQTEIVIDGFEQGIADSAYEGIEDMRNINIFSSPKQGSVTFANAAVTLPPSGYIGVAFNASASGDFINTSSTSGFYQGMAVLVVSVSGSAGLTAGTTYYAGDVTASSFKLYNNLGMTSVRDITSNITGTFTVQTFGTPTDSYTLTRESSTGNGVFFFTSDGLVWYISPNSSATVPINTLQFLGNTSHSTAGDETSRGITLFNNYLFVFQRQAIDYIALSNITGTSNPSSSWVYAWQLTTTATEGHRALAATDNALYFCNHTNVGSVLVNSGSTFDPANSATYTYNASALALPFFDRSVCLAQLGVNLLVGGASNFIYPWDRVSPTFNYPLIVAEPYVSCLVSANSNAYVFAGKRGRIYITNGANIELFKKFPDSLSGTVDPYYTWGWGLYWKNKLYFTLSAKDNSSTTISNFAGLWCIDLNTNALTMSNSMSYGTYAGTIATIVSMGRQFPTGDGIFSGWLNSTGGIDYTSANPYTNYEPYIDTDIIPVGTFLTKNTFNNIEFKLGKPLVSGEKVKLSYRKNLTDSFTQIGETTTAGLLSDLYTMNFQGIQWLQIRANTSSTATTPSYVPIREIRIR